MNDWARWRAADFSGSVCLLGQAMSGRPDVSVYSSMIPLGAEAPRWLCDLERAIEAGTQAGRGEAMAAIRVRYLAPRASHEEIAIELGISQRTLTERLREARTWLDAWLAGKESRA